MTVLEAILLGTLQGLTEFLPISSSGHLVLAQRLLGVQGAGVLIDVLLHLGTLGAVMAVYGRDVVRLAAVLARALLGSEFWASPAIAIRRSADLRLICLLFVASIPAGIIGYTFRELFVPAFESVTVVGFMLILTGLVLQAPRLRTRKAEGRLSLPTALLVGCAQAIALVPGVSRSGSTISVALLCGVEASAAARFSFLLSVPAILGASVLELGEVSLSSFDTAVWAGVLSSFLVGWAALTFLLALLRRGRFAVFSWYCFGLGILAIGADLL